MLAVLPLAATAPAAAQETGATAVILGEWAFEAASMYEGCTLTGEVVIRQGAEPGFYECSIVARDYCPGVWDYTAEQSCVAARKGDQLSILSTLESVEPPTDTYWADNFMLTIVDDANMVGELRSVYDSNARLYRRDGPIS